MGYGATAAHQTLNLWILVRIQVSQQQNNIEEKFRWIYRLELHHSGIFC